ncbi:DinB family protein [Paenibacillus pinisoli]|uniref:DinB family protein n=1 Tax=Paenibacillus pinisoli TaxID=1276110 RepID=A0A3A6PBR8_9BACL|nr:DinB family protein [Paenibacillus pinisoli]RJX37927.1 DinB family protein [Paenibacillus pinisoli]
MSDTYILNLFADLRKQILSVITGMSKVQIEHIPKGFNNNLHWQIGHVLTITDDLIFEFSGVGARMPQHYRTYFASGTSPSSWPEQPPGIDTLLKELENQMVEIGKKYDGRLAQPVADENNFLQASVIGELFHVLIAHESTHLGMIIAMSKVLQHE